MTESLAGVHEGCFVDPSCQEVFALKVSARDVLAPDHLAFGCRRGLEAVAVALIHT